MASNKTILIMAALLLAMLLFCTEEVASANIQEENSMIKVGRRLFQVVYVDPGASGGGGYSPPKKGRRNL